MNYKLLILSVVLQPLLLFSQNDNFYNEDSIVQVEIFFDQADYWQQMLDNYEDKINIAATVIINGETFDSTGVRFKGSTSFLGNPSDKKSFALSLNEWVEDQDVGGYNTLNLNGGFEDPSAMREILYNWYGRQYGLSLKSNIAQLSINGENWGPYINVQQLNSDYIEEWFANTDGTRWRSGVGFSGGPGGASLNYLGEDTVGYSSNYTLKNTNKTDFWSDLIQTAKVLETTTLDTTFYDALEQVLDVDKTVWFLAHETIFSDEDSYIIKGGRDYYIYWDSLTGQITPLEYDGNSTMYPENAFWDLFYNEDNPSFALCYRFFQTPELRQRYLAHVRTILEQYVKPDTWEARIDSYANILDTLVLNDPQAIYSYQQFQDNQDSLRSFLEQRRTFILANEEVNRPVPTLVGQLLPEGFGLPVNEALPVSVSVAAGAGVARVKLYYSTGLYGTFDRAEMRDDGISPDMQSGDGIYTGLLPAQAPLQSVRYYFEATAADDFLTAAYLPARAAQNAFVYQTGQLISNSEVVINEVLSSNGESIADEFGEFDDWIELYNTGTTVADLSGYYLSDDALTPAKWQMPQGLTLEPDDYLLIWADKDEEQGDLHADFKLSGSGEQVILSDVNLAAVDLVDFPETGEDISFARLPNGIGNFAAAMPSPLAENTSLPDPVSTRQKQKLPIKIYPNPASHYLNIEGNLWTGVLSLIDVEGQVIRQFSVAEDTIKIDLKELSVGIYYLQEEGGFSAKFLIVR